MTSLRIALACLACASVGHAQPPPPAFDVVIRHGTVIDGSGNPRFDADLAIRDGFIVAIGDLDAATATTQVDATGLFVTPGFINIHSHASPDALPTAVNMLTQGVTTEIFNADGNGPLDIAQQMQTLAASGLAVNIGGYIGFNAAWQTVNGNADQRPTPEAIARMRALITKGLDEGAWGVSAGLDYKPGYFARTEEVIKIVDVARPARTNFTNHDRITPESNYSSKVGVLGRYVREQQIMSWEEAIRKSSALPAATIGMVDRGLIAVGMAAGLAVLDPATVIDRATYEQPALPSEGIRYVLVNGKLALTSGVATGVRSGRAMFRTVNMPSRPMDKGTRRLAVKGVSAGSRVVMALTQRAGARRRCPRFHGHRRSARSFGSRRGDRRCEC